MTQAERCGVMGFKMGSTRLKRPSPRRPWAACVGLHKEGTPASLPRGALPMWLLGWGSAKAEPHGEALPLFGDGVAPR